MRIDVATLFPDMVETVLEASILGRARRAGVVDVALYDIRDFSTDRHRSVDARPYGGGPGMLLRVDVVVPCIERIRRERGPGTVVLLTPQGERFDQGVARRFAAEDHLILICGRYEGFDERIRTLLAPCEVSLGDFVLTGGEIPALAVIDAVVRLLPGALGHAGSAETESWSDGDRLEGPQYTRPPSYRDLVVPEVLTSGDHARIEAWRDEGSRERTERRTESQSRERVRDPSRDPSREQ